MLNILYITKINNAYSIIRIVNSVAISMMVVESAMPHMYKPDLDRPC